jgi:type IV pilus assembly PilO-like protein
MSNTRPWILGAAALSVLLAVAGWFLLISPERSKAADLKTQRATQVQKNQQLQLDIAQLKAEFNTLPTKQAELAKIKQQLPNNPALPSLVRSLTTIANQSGAGLTSVSPGAPVAVTTTNTTSASGATTVTAAPAGLVSIPITIVVDGTYAQSELFLQKLQNAVTRAFLVQHLSIAVLDSPSLSNSTPVAPSGNLLRSTISGQIFVLQNQAPAASGTTTGAGSTTTTTTPAS